MGADFIMVMGKTPEALPERFEGPVSDDLLSDLQDWTSDELSREDAVDLINEALHSVVHHDRIYGFVRVTEPGDYIIAGGLTWGDSPEGFDEIGVLLAAGILQPPERTNS